MGEGGLMAKLTEVDFDPFAKAAPKKTSTPADFADAYGGAAERAGKQLGVDPKALLAQWGLETGWGKSVVPGTNNLGNIKDFTGSGVGATDNMTGSRDKYRAFGSADEFADHYVGLMGRKYKGVQGAGSDIGKFSAGLAGYAEDPRYADKLQAAYKMVGSATNPVQRAVDAVTSAVMPSAQAATAKLTEVDYDPFAAKPQEAAKPEPSLMEKVDQFGKNRRQELGNLAAGAVRGAGSIGSTIMAPYDMAKDAMDGKGLSLESNRARRAGMDNGLAAMGAETNSTMYGLGRLGGEIAGTAGVGGALANGVRAVSQAPRALAFANALQTGGFKAGEVPGAANMLTRMAGGAAAGGAAAGAINPSDARTGAIVGGLLPPALAGVGAAAGYVGRNVGALAEPFTTKGQERIAGRMINKFAEGGPTKVNAAELVPGSTPTLAEATGNAGIARMQSNVRDVRPNAFVAREEANAAARVAALDDLAGDAGKLDFFKGERSEVGKKLYGDAMASGIDPAAVTPAIKGEIKQLVQRPSIKSAMKDARKLAAEDGLKLTDSTSLEGLHYTKLSLDQQINSAVREGNGTLARSLMGTKDKLEGVMTNLSPSYAEARATFAEMSKPVNQMEVLQSLKLTDQKGNVTLAKIQNAIDGLERKMSGPGTNAAKSLTTEQMGALKAVRDDLLRQTNLNAGRSAGNSATFQNIATDNIISTLLPGKLGGFVTNKAGGVLGQVGQLAYNKPNEAIRNKLADLMLDPAAAQMAMNPGAAQLGGVRKSMNALAAQGSPLLYRTAPVLSSSR